MTTQSTVAKARRGRDGRYHFLYVTYDLDTFEWYGGKHSTSNLADGYRGSGLWVTGHPQPERLVTEAIEFFDTEEVVYAAEREWITANSISSDTLCRNRIEGGIGWTNAGIVQLRASMAPERLAQWTAKKSVSVRATLMKMSPEERSAKASKAWVGKTPEQRSEIARRAWASFSPEQQASRMTKLGARLHATWQEKTDADKARINAKRSHTCKIKSARISPDEHGARIRGWLKKNPPEKRSEIARLRWAARTPEERSAIVKRSNATRRALRAKRTDAQLTAS